MYLSRLFLNPRNRAVRRDLADCQDLHRTIMRAFPSAQDAAMAPNAEGVRGRYGVLHRLEICERTGRIALYIQSREQPDWSALPIGYLSPDVPMENLVVKSVAESYGRIREGMIFRFRLRANPTRKVDTKSGSNGERNNGRRVPITGNEALADWLQRKAAVGGFRLLDFDIRWEGLDAKVSGSHPAGKISLRASVFEGRLVVTDPALFRATLENGIGTAKAYGFGLLSIAPDAA